MLTAEDRTINTANVLNNNASPNTPFFQPKLTINAPGDKYEQEADAMADKVMRMPMNDKLFFSPMPLSISRLQRKCQHCEEEERKIHRKESANVAIPNVSSAVEQTLQSTGQLMDKSTRSFMEARFGYDFGNVKIHNDSLAHQSSREINALAYTHGNHVVFGNGHYQPNSNQGRQLLAHELVHVVQQQNINVSRHTHKNIDKNLIGSEEKTDVIQTNRNEEVKRQPANEDQVQVPLWANSSSDAPIPGVPVPEYEKPTAGYAYTDKDWETFQDELAKRERINKKNAGLFISDYSSAVISLWGAHVSKVMADAGKIAGWSFFDKMLKFIAIKTIEIVASELLTPAAVEIFETFGKALSEKVAEKGIEAISAYAGEHIAEAAEEGTKDAQIEVAKEQVDKVTESLSKLLATINVDAINALPDIAPYGRWLGEIAKAGQYSELAKFRLPPVFPVVKAVNVYGIVSGIIMALLNATGSNNYVQAWFAGKHQTNGPVKLHSSDDLITAAFKVPVSQLLSIPIVITDNYSESIESTGKKLMELYRSSGVAYDGEISEFVEAYGQDDVHPYIINIKEDSDGKVTVQSGSLYENLTLYKWAYDDWSLQFLADAIIELAENSTAVPINSESSEIQTATALAKATREYLTEDIKLMGARNMLKYVKTLKVDPPEGYYGWK